ncbi:MAG: hypothetical protein ACI9DC_001298 [Gammaproteobacteria bacterium]|jgi:hypothetical protein
MLTDIEITEQSPLVGAATFGDTGAYERIDGVATGTLDPAHPGNRGIALLDRAPVNAEGRVEYRSDFVLLTPASPQLGNGRLLYEVNNRGRIMMIANLCAGVAGNRWNSIDDLGNTLPFRRGFSLLWSGWDAGAPKATGLSFEVPAIDGLTQRIREEFVSGTRLGVHEMFKLSHEAATQNATLTVRRTQTAERHAVPFVFTDTRTVRLLPEGTLPATGSIYEIHYDATRPRVQGIGFAATRDLVSHLRAHAQRLTGRNISHTLAFGISQAGRYLRDHIAQGFNADEAGQRVFDGVYTHVAGIGRVFHNAPFAQPFRTRTWHEDHDFPEVEFPFSSTLQIDPASGEESALLTGAQTDPKLIESNTSTEYWQKGASLLHTDPLGAKDLPLPENVRGYLLAGTQHGGKAGMPKDTGSCVNSRNWHDPMAAVRALLMALDEWVATDRAPPDSRLPSIAEGTLVAVDALRFPSLPGVTAPRAANDVIALPDWTAPDKAAARYVALVPQVDVDGNEIAGIRLPDIAVPRGTFCGWNLYAEPYPVGELADREGTFMAFTASTSERTAANDPRLSIAERYHSEDGYIAKRRDAIDALVEARLLLADDVQDSPLVL